MHRETLEIAALLGSRICHDLISPIGAISNGVELLAMSGAGSLPELDLIAQSVEHASARIGFFRVAFGAAAADDVLGEAELRQILDDVTRGSRMSIRWDVGGEAPRPEVKLAFLLLNCLESAMPRGGTLTVLRPDDGWKIVAEAPRMRIDPKLWQALTQSGAHTRAGAAEVQFLLAPLLAGDLGRAIKVEHADGGVTVRF